MFNVVKERDVIIKFSENKIYLLYNCTLSF